MVYDKPMTTISIREAMHWGDSLVLPQSIYREEGRVKGILP